MSDAYDDDHEMFMKQEQEATEHDTRCICIWGDHGRNIGRIPNKACLVMGHKPEPVEPSASLVAQQCLTDISSSPYTPYECIKRAITADRQRHDNLKKELSDYKHAATSEAGMVDELQTENQTLREWIQSVRCKNKDNNWCWCGELYPVPESMTHDIECITARKLLNVTPEEYE